MSLKIQSVLSYSTCGHGLKKLQKKPTWMTISVQNSLTKENTTDSGNLRSWGWGCRRVALFIVVNAIVIGSAISTFLFLEILRTPVPLFPYFHVQVPIFRVPLCITSLRAHACNHHLGESF